jgi:hypothetical protein
MFVIYQPGSACLKVTLFWEADRAASCGPVTASGGCVIAGHLQQMRADRVEAVVPGQQLASVQGLQQVEAGPRSSYHRDGDGAIECDHRVVGDALEQLVQGEDLWPVRVLHALGLVVHRGDGRLQLVRACRPLGQRVGDERHALPDGSPVPKIPVLLCERDKASVGPGACRAPRVG